MSKAVQYAKNEKQYLYRFLEDSDIPIHNNRVENAIRPFVVGRKNWLFSDSVKGAEASAVFNSLAATATANGISAELYFTELLTYPTKILLPWNWCSHFSAAFGRLIFCQKAGALSAYESLLWISFFDNLLLQLHFTTREARIFLQNGRKIQTENPAAGRILCLTRSIRRTSCVNRSTVGKPRENRGGFRRERNGDNPAPVQDWPQNGEPYFKR